MKPLSTYTFRFLVISLILVLISSLTIKQDHLKANHKLAEQFGKKTQHKLVSLFHIQATKDEQDDQLGTEFLQDFMAFIFSDREISDSIFEGTPLSEQAVGRIKDFLLTNKPFNDLLLQLLDEDPNSPKCYTSLEESKKRKIITTVIQQYDFNLLLNSDDLNQTNKEQMQKIKSKLSNDPDLGPSVVQCLNKNPKFLMMPS